MKKIKVIFAIKTCFLFGIFLMMFSVQLNAQKENKHIRNGNDFYADGNYQEAEIQYMKALEANPISYKGQYNVGNSIYKQENFEDAITIYNNLITKATDKKSKADAYYNLGNSLLKAQKLEESIEAYKNGLRNNPNDPDIKYNLSYAQKLRQQQQQQDKEDQKKQEPSEFAKKLKEQADQLINQFKFEEAYRLMVDGMQKDQTVSAYKDFIKRIEDIVKIEKEKS
jgi:tetratricopeptide (TPR) repeat protein